MAGEVQRLVGALVLAAALSACGGGSDRAGGGTTTTLEPTTLAPTTSSVTEGPTTTVAATPTTRRPNRPLPGPVVPSTPVAEKVARWHADLTARTTASCTRLVQETTAAKGEAPLDDVLILLYRGAGEGCLGRTSEARATLGEARRTLADLPSSQLDRATPRCRPQELLSWAFFTYLDTEIPTTCPPPPTTTSSSSPSTSSTTRTSQPTTTRRP